MTATNPNGSGVRKYCLSCEYEGKELSIGGCGECCGVWAYDTQRTLMECTMINCGREWNNEWNERSDPPARREDENHGDCNEGA